MEARDLGHIEAFARRLEQLLEALLAGLQDEVARPDRRRRPVGAAVGVAGGGAPGPARRADVEEEREQATALDQRRAAGRRVLAVVRGTGTALGGGPAVGGRADWGG